MVLELAILDVIRGKEDEFERAFKEAKGIIASMPGFLSLELQRCLEAQNRYLLLVRWSRLEDHTVGFRQSSEPYDEDGILHIEMIRPPC